MIGLVFEVNGFVSMVFLNFSSRWGNYLGFRIYYIYLVIKSLPYYRGTVIPRFTIHPFTVFPHTPCIFPFPKLANFRVCDFSPRDISLHPDPNHNPHPDLSPYHNSAVAVTCLKIDERERNYLEIYIVRSPNCTLNRGMTVFGYIP